ncbi:MAG: hypothetical protein JKY70_05625 [Mucilaginibacter sp.]|nr:hypothetical protein [Mucilaginibacter sp.]
MAALLKQLLHEQRVYTEPGTGVSQIAKAWNLHISNAGPGPPPYANQAQQPVMTWQFLI